jgi:hypothetical protein
MLMRELPELFVDERHHALDRARLAGTRAKQ